MSTPAHSILPSVDRVLRQATVGALIAQYGRATVAEALRTELACRRAALVATGSVDDPDVDHLVAQVGLRLACQSVPSIRRVFNLTGTVLHTNLGRAVLPTEAIDAAIAVAGNASNLEYEVAEGRRGDRDDHVERQLCRVTGAEAATVVNNNAAALLLILNSLALRKEVPVSRGELIEIGGAFRLPDIMSRSGCRLREVGTTNRTHLHDFATAIGPKTGLVMKVHTSNYVIEGFTTSVPEVELARMCRERDVPFVVDLGSGTLVDLRAYGLPHEPTPAEAIAHGADIVTFSGDKLLGGPQAGIIVGRAHLVAKAKRNPLKRALRVDKMTIAALSAVLNLYSDHERLRLRLPTLRFLTRPLEEIRESAARVQAAIVTKLNELAVSGMSVDLIACESEIGSGALPTRRIPSAAVAIAPTVSRGRGTTLKRLAHAFRSLPTPVIGRIQDDAFVLDCRCLDHDEEFLAQMRAFVLGERDGA